MQGCYNCVITANACRVGVALDSGRDAVLVSDYLLALGTGCLALGQQAAVPEQAGGTLPLHLSPS